MREGHCLSPISTCAHRVVMTYFYYWDYSLWGVPKRRGISKVKLSGASALCGRLCNLRDFLDG